MPRRSALCRVGLTAPDPGVTGLRSCAGKGGTVKVHTKLLAVGGAVVVVLSGGASSAGAYDPDHPNPKAVANCEENINKQSAKGISAGGGPKQGVPAPTNCDKFFTPPGQQP